MLFIYINNRKTWPNIAKFGLSIAMCSALYKVTQCLIKASKYKLKPEYESFIAGAVSSLGLSLASDREIYNFILFSLQKLTKCIYQMSLLCMIIYPRVFEVLLRLMAEKGWVKDFKHSGIVFFMICSMICVYCYIFEPNNLPVNYVRGINNFSLLTKGEATMFATVAEQTSRIIEKFYGVKQIRT